MNKIANAVGLLLNERRIIFSTPNDIGNMYLHISFIVSSSIKRHNIPKRIDGIIKEPQFAMARLPNILNSISPNKIVEYKYTKRNIIFLYIQIFSFHKLKVFKTNNMRSQVCNIGIIVYRKDMKCICLAANLP